jgi:hypothetical protein
MKDGALKPLIVGNLVHEHPMMIAVYRAKVYKEMRRAIELVQPSRRSRQTCTVQTAGGPVDIFLSNTIELPGTIFEARIGRHDIETFVQMSEADGFRPCIESDGNIRCPVDELMTRVYPDRFPDEKAAKRHRQNIKLPIEPGPGPFRNPVGFIIPLPPGSYAHQLYVARHRTGEVEQKLHAAFPDAEEFRTIGCRPGKWDRKKVKI